MKTRPDLHGLRADTIAGAMLWLLLLACQEPFGADRHDLVGHRIAAVEVDLDDDEVRPRGALITAGRTWSDDPPRLRWHWLPSPEALDTLDAATPADAEGAAPNLGAVPGATPVLGLVATWADGTERRAFVDLAAPTRAGLRPTALPAAPLPLDPLVGDGDDDDDDDDDDMWSLEARRALPPGEGPLQAGGAARLTAEGVAPGDTVRWMATVGTFLELDPATTDWFAGELVLDDDEVESYRPAPAGTVTFLALSLGDGRGTFRAADHHVGVAPEGTFVAGRWVPGPPRVQPGWVSLVADDTAPLGLAVDATLQGPDAPPPCGVHADGSLDPDALLTGACARADLDGASVWLEPDP